MTLFMCLFLTPGYPLGKCMENILLTNEGFEVGESTQESKLYDWLASGKWLTIEGPLVRNEGLHTEGKL